MTDGTDRAAHGIEDIRAAVGRGRTAGRSWAALGARERRTALLRWKRALASRADEFAEVIAAETGKPVHDARSEVLLTLVHLDWAARNASRVLVGGGCVRGCCRSISGRCWPTVRSG